MFDVEVCEPKRVVLIRFRGELAAADFTALDAMGREMQGGPPYDVIFDMTGVEKSHVATDFVVPARRAAPGLHRPRAHLRRAAG